MEKGFCRDIAMDLGTTSVQVAVRGRGIVLEEPSVGGGGTGRTGKILEVGQAARQMHGRTPGELVAVRPLEQGYIADCTMAEEMVSAFLRKALPRRLFKPRLLLCVPSGSAEVAERAVVEAGVRAGARKVYLMEEPLAAALGAGIDIRQPQGHMVVDIGGGTTDVAVTALGGVVASVCLATAGDQFDQALIQYVRQHHDLLIGARTAQAVKEAIGQVAGEGEESAAVKGRCLTSGLPRPDHPHRPGNGGGLRPRGGGHRRRRPPGLRAHAPGAGRRRGRKRPAAHRRRELAAGA